MQSTKSSNNHHGFTLVELIVVIAIIAILAAVSVVGFSSYIEKARYSNDNSVAVQLTNSLSNYFILNQDSDLEAYEVRTIIEDIIDGEFDWTPESKNSGFFYVQSTKKIIVAKFDEIIEEGYLLSVTPDTVLLNDAHQLNQTTTGTPGNTPEEFFSEGVHLLSTSGSVVADVIYGIRMLATSSDIESDYEDLVDMADTRTTGLSGIFGGGRDVKEVIDAFIAEYSLDNTVYVNNLRWQLTSQQRSATNELWETITPKRIVYAFGMTTVPSYPSSGSYIDLDTVYLPNSIQSIQPNAFTRFTNPTLEIVMNPNKTIRVAEDAFRPATMATLVSASTTIIVGLDLIEIPMVEIEIDETTYEVESGDELSLSKDAVNFKLVVDSLPDTVLSRMTGFTMTARHNGDYFIYVYSNEGVFASFEFNVQFS